MLHKYVNPAVSIGLESTWLQTTRSWWTDHTGHLILLICCVWTRPVTSYIYSKHWMRCYWGFYGKLAFYSSQHCGWSQPIIFGAAPLKTTASALMAEIIKLTDSFFVKTSTKCAFYMKRFYGVNQSIRWLPSSSQFIQGKCTHSQSTRLDRSI